MDSPKPRRQRLDRNLVTAAETVVPEGREDPDPAVPGREAADWETGTGGQAQAGPAPGAVAPDPEDPVPAPEGPRNADFWAAAPIASAMTDSPS